MNLSRVIVGLGLVVLMPWSFTACGGDADESSEVSDDEATQETQDGLGSEDPWPGPGGLPLGGPSPSGPGPGAWGGGWGADPQYAPYCGGHDPDPYKASRNAKQREYDRIAAENRRHGGGSSQNDGEVSRHYPGGVREAPPVGGSGGVSDPVLLGQCLSLVGASVPKKEEFCRTLPRDNDARERCWSHRYSRVAWAGWCYFEFTD